jgi:hypothetical protein
MKSQQMNVSYLILTRIFDNADGGQSLSTSNLINEQKSDPEISSLIAQASDEKEIAK